MAQARLGELLIETKIISEAQLVEGLRLQVMWGGRLGTVLSELGYVDLDTLSRVLGWQHSMPAALAKHFDEADRAVQRRFDVDLAEWYACLPLRTAGKRIIVATTGPLADKALTSIAKSFEVPNDYIVPAIAAELRIRYQLENVYGIARSQRYLRAPGTERSGHGARPATPPPIPEKVTLAPYYTEPSDGIPKQEPTGFERRRYVPLLGNPAAHKVRAKTDADVGLKERVPLPLLDFATALDRILSANSAADVAAGVVDALGHFVEQARGVAMFVVRGAIATSWASFAASGTARLGPVAIALDKPGAMRLAIGERALKRIAVGEMSPPDRSLLQMLGTERDELVLVPIEAEKDIVAVVALALAPGTSTERILDITAAAAHSLARLMRNSSQRLQRA
jgi:hypothetical protein